MFVVSPKCMKGATLTFESASIRGGCRSIWASIIETPGKVKTAQYVSLWVELKEHRPLDGEPWTSATRRVSNDHRRVGLTPGAERELKAEISKALHAYGGFEKAWHDARHQPDGLKYSGAGGASEAARLRELAAWWDEVQRMTDLIEMDPSLVEYRPLLRPDIGRHPASHSRPCRSYQGRTEWATPEVYVLFDGEHIGWLDTDGHLLPLLDLRGQLCADIYGRDARQESLTG